MKRRYTAAAVLVLSVAVALASVIFKDRSAYRCSYDGNPITPVYEVDIRLRDGGLLRFCSVSCAIAWLREGGEGVEAVVVTDEVSGERLDPAIAYFVESDVVTDRATGNRIHVFRERSTAVAHARRHSGRLLDNPFTIP